MERNEKSINYIINLIKDLNREFFVKHTIYAYLYNFFVFLGENEYKIEFPRSLMDDFEIALDKYKNSDYFRSLDSAIKFNIYVKLGMEGLLRKDFLISKAILNEKRDWIKDYKVETLFNKEITEVFFNGLKDINIFLASLLKKYDSLDLANIKEDQERINNLIKYYESNHNLNSKGVSVRNLQYLKSAAVEQILVLENLKVAEQKPSILKAIDRKIYSIVEQLRKDPFLQIMLPEFIYDLEKEQRGSR